MSTVYIVYKVYILYAPGNFEITSDNRVRFEFNYVDFGGHQREGVYRISASRDSNTLVLGLHYRDLDPSIPAYIH